MMACARSVDSDLEDDEPSSGSCSSRKCSSGPEQVSDGRCHQPDPQDRSRRKSEEGSSLSKEDADSENFKRSRTLTFRKKKAEKTKDSKKSRGHFWTFRLKKRLPVRLKKNKEHGLPEAQQNVESGVCVCTGYRRTEEHVLGPGVVFASQRDIRGPAPRPHSTIPVLGATAPGLNLGIVQSMSGLRLFQQVPAPNQPTRGQLLDPTQFNPEEYPTEDIDELMIAQRARDIEQGIEISPRHVAYPSTVEMASLTTPSIPDPQPQIWALSTALQTQCVVNPTSTPPPPIVCEEAPSSSEESQRNYRGLMPPTYIPRQVHTQVDYIHCLVPDLLQITNCSFYWGVMDRYEAEKLLENKPEGTFLLRDSAQEEFLFSVSFRRYGRSLHARIEQWNHKFSFDSHDPGVFASDSVCGLIEHYKDPSCCMFFEPMLTLPLHRSFAFSLQHLCRAVIGNQTSYDGMNYLPLPKSLRQYLKYYHYKQKVRVRKFECQH